MSLHTLSTKFIASPAAVRTWRVLACLLVLAVCWLAFSPHPPPLADTGWDKANHLLAFVALSVAMCFGFPGSRWRTLATAAALLAFGGAIEIVQGGVAGRSSEWADLLADLAGIALGTLLAGAVLRRVGTAHAAPARGDMGRSRPRYR